LSSGFTRISIDAEVTYTRRKSHHHLDNDDDHVVFGTAPFSDDDDDSGDKKCGPIVKIFIDNVRCETRQCQMRLAWSPL